jgi:polysaccharide export outer membrane protein
MNKKNWQLSTLSTWLIITAPILGLPLDTVAAQPTQEASVTTLQETDYIVGAGDLLRLDIFQVAEYSGEYLVLVDGTITLPLIGRLPVAGLTLTQMSEQISKGYEEYLKRPLATVSLVSPRPLKIGIAGEIANPGSYAFNFQEKQQFPTVTYLIEKAGGLTTIADIEKIEIRRQIAGKTEILTINLWELVNEGNLDQDITLRDGDEILIPTKTAVDYQENRQLTNLNFGIQAGASFPITIIGEIYRPGSYEIEPKKDPTTGKGDAPSLTGAIAKAGGIKPLADVRNIEIHRLTHTGEAQIFTVNLWQLLQEGDINQDVILQEGDKIIIPTAAQLSPEEASLLADASFAPDSIEVKVVGEVTTPGAVKLAPNTPLNQAILAAGGFNQGRAKQKEVELIRLNPNGTVSKRSIAVDFTQNLNEEQNPALRENDVIVVRTTGGARFGDTMNAIFGPLRGLPLVPLLN